MISPASSGIKNGFIGGLLAVIVSLVLYFVSADLMLQISNWSNFLISIVFMVLAGLAVKKSNDGFLSFGEGFMASWLTYVIFALLGAIFSYLLFNVIDPDLSELIKARTIATMQSMMEIIGGDEDQMEETLSIMEDQDYSMSAGKTGLGFLMSALFGAIPSAIIALIIRKKRN